MGSSIVIKSGQALIEYLLLFGFMSMLSVSLVRGIMGKLNESVGMLGHELTQEFSVGVCPTDCFYSGYINQQKGGP